jgi:hypothetical protein
LTGSTIIGAAGFAAYLRACGPHNPSSRWKRLSITCKNSPSGVSILAAVIFGFERRRGAQTINQARVRAAENSDEASNGAAPLEDSLSATLECILTG